MKTEFKQGQRAKCKNCGDSITYLSGCWVHPQFIYCRGGCLNPEPDCSQLNKTGGNEQNKV
jgi:hypothetical protein